MKKHMCCLQICSGLVIEYDHFRTWYPTKAMLMSAILFITIFMFYWYPQILSEIKGYYHKQEHQVHQDHGIFCIIYIIDISAAASAVNSVNSSIHNVVKFYPIRNHWLEHSQLDDFPFNIRISVAYLSAFTSTNVGVMLSSLIACLSVTNITEKVSTDEMKFSG